MAQLNIQEVLGAVNTAPKGRTITIEYIEDGKYGISCEHHDAYVYSGKDAYEAVQAYESDRNCRVGDVYNYPDGSLLFSMHADEEMF